MSLPLFPTTDAERKAIPIWTYITKYVPRALIAATRVSVKGNIQHNPERSPTDIVWARGKSMDQLNTAARHLMDHSNGTIYDTDGELHLAKAYWRIGAELELLCERLEAEKAKKQKRPSDAELLHGGETYADGEP
ncbi:MAG TPA: DUF5664 domain-containing protein [Burkholderiaceae bacterium]|nr:DUF5664 domain-containing protein [Burkholderiaceae bacterium]